MDKQKQIEETQRKEHLKQVRIDEMASIIQCVLIERTDIKYISDLCMPIAEELMKYYQPKIPENAVVFIPTEERYALLSKEEYEIVKNSVDLLREYESVSNSLIKSSELCRKLVEDKKELKRQLKQAHKEMAEKFAEMLKEEAFVVFMGEPIIRASKIDKVCKEITEGKKDGRM